MAINIKPLLSPENGIELCRVREEGVVRGFKKDILTDNLTEREKGLLVCPRCQGILREACFPNTGEYFCLSCKKRGEWTYPNLQVIATVLLLKSSCPIHERGCKWVGNLGECEKHLKECEYVYEMCKIGCGLVFSRHELKVHSKECSHRIVLCEHCNAGFKYRDLPTHHNMCHRMPVRCVLGCDKLVIRENMTQHMDTECGEKEVNCPFLQYGCKVGLIRRKEMNQHLEDRNNEHMTMKVNSLEETVMKQNENISLLSQKMEDLLEGGVNNYDTVHWNVEGITDILERNESLTSEEYILSSFRMTFTLIASENILSIGFRILGRQRPNAQLNPRGRFITRLVCHNDRERTLRCTSRTYMIGEQANMLQKLLYYSTKGEIATIHRDRILANFIRDGGIEFEIALLCFKYI